MQKILPWLGIFSGIPFALLYGMLARFVFASAGQSGSGSSTTNTIAGVVSLAFVCFMPLASGAIVVLLAPPSKRESGLYAFFMPWLATTLSVILAAVFAIEYMICVVMALPILLVMSS